MTELLGNFRWVDVLDIVILYYVFYRALLQGAGLDPVDQLVAALKAEGLNPLPIFLRKR